MSLQPGPIPPVPDATAAVARAAFRRLPLAVRLRDEFGALYADADFAALFPARGQPALPPWRPALVTVLQFVEGLLDRRAAEAVRARIDWKYALSLELTDRGLDHSVLSEFRSRLLAGSLRDGGTEQVLLDRRLELVGESVRAALNALAAAAPAWLRAVAPPEWEGLDANLNLVQVDACPRAPSPHARRGSAPSSRPTSPEAPSVRPPRACLARAARGPATHCWRRRAPWRPRRAGTR